MLFYKGYPVTFKALDSCLLNEDLLLITLPVQRYDIDHQLCDRVPTKVANVAVWTKQKLHKDCNML